MNTLELAWQEIDREAKILAGMPAFPIWSDAGSWVTAEFEQNERGVLPHHGSWMVGDLPAILWFLATDAGADRDAKSTELAFTWSSRLANRATLTSFASVSHLFFRGVFLPMAISADRRLMPLAEEAARTICDRFVEIGYMKSFGTPADSAYPFTTVDDLINLAIPTWYAQRTGNDGLLAKVTAAAELIGERLVRPDGSAAQVLLFDESGKPSGVDTYQGFSKDGCWSRGQAWGIYGFATLYRQTKNPAFLNWAQSVTEYWMTHLTDEPAPLWDFDLPADQEPIRDTFAATLAYAGMLELAEVSDAARKAEIVGYVRQMLEKLSLKYVIDQPRGHGIVSGAALDVPHNHGIGGSVIVGDSYFTEAIWHLRMHDKGQDTPSLLPA